METLNTKILLAGRQDLDLIEPVIYDHIIIPTGENEGVYEDMDDHELRVISDNDFTNTTGLKAWFGILNSCGLHFDLQNVTDYEECVGFRIKSEIYPILKKRQYDR